MTTLPRAIFPAMSMIKIRKLGGGNWAGPRWKNSLQSLRPLSCVRTLLKAVGQGLYETTLALTAVSQPERRRLDSAYLNQHCLLECF